MKQIMVSIILLFGIVVGIFATNGQTKKELLRNISVQHDTVRMETLRKLTKLPDQHILTKKHYTNELLKEAKKQKNLKYQCIAYLNQIFFSFNNQSLEGVQYWMKELEQVSQKKSLREFYYQGEQCLIGMLILNEEYELAEQRARSMLEDAEEFDLIYGIIIANQCLAESLSSTHRYQESINILEHILTIFPEEKYEQTWLEINNYLISLHSRMKNYSQWLKYLKQKEERIKKEIKKDSTHKDYYKGDLMMTYLAYMNYYIEMNQEEQVIKYKLLVDEHYTDEYLVYSINYYKGMSIYYKYLKQSEQALEYINRLAAILKDISYVDYCLVLESKADILFEMSSYREALKIRKELTDIKDSLQVSIYHKQIEQIRTDYNKNKVFLERSHIEKNFQLVILGFLVIMIVILTFFTIRYNRIRRSLGKSEKDIRRMVKMAETAKQAKERFLINMSNVIQTPLNEIVTQSLKLVSNDKIEEREREDTVQIITKTSSLLMSLVNEILDLSRLESGRMKFTISELDIYTFFHDCISSVSGVSVRFDAPYAEDKIMIDGARLAQVVKNLLTPEKEGATVEIKLARKTNKQSAQLLVTVTGTALGGSSQEIIILNEINRMIIEHFDGVYEIKAGIVSLTLNLSSPH